MPVDSSRSDTQTAVRSLSAIAFALLYYDYALTFGAEVERFWRFRMGRPSWGGIGFFLNRYLSVLGHIPVIWEFFGSEACEPMRILCFPSFDNGSLVHRSLLLQVYHQMLAGVAQVVIVALQISRVYALYSGSRKVLCTLIGLSVVVFAISGWAISDTFQTQCSVVTDQPSGTQGNCDSEALQTEGRFLAVVWASMLVFDIAIFGCTLRRVLQVRDRSTWTGGLFTLMLRDGAIYFGVLLLCHLANILVCMLAEPAYKDPSVTITTVVATVLISRLMLNIRDPDLRTQHFHLTSNNSAV
ncbi:hypothetical protein L227DRAFT_610899 [Lentinus tigrinus ALCF2SS1-6]|uniref:DUF6533 domain-containing protein n=1 Tax=Lentinus tigrinus ALCF2SS1-6 TaxID=1328759 RepID=A0A5C2SAB9_9APHY|nr:hypothetical protein L227DRAFT_610899 [Lentinus tigrinus ALCF2SS1-6]